MLTDGFRARPVSLPRAVLALAGALLLASAASPATAQQKGGAVQARADLQDPSGQVVGTATFSESAAGVQIVVQVRGLTPGQHGIHVHATGRCDPPDFMSAGAHFNPTSAQHGLQNPSGPHAGDLPNLTAAADGITLYTATTTRLTLSRGAPNSLFQDGSTALVIHADPDDQVSDPTGNSGGRVACGVIRPV